MIRRFAYTQISFEADQPNPEEIVKKSLTAPFRAFIGAALLCVGLWVAPTTVPAAGADELRPTPELPPQCSTLQVDPGNKLAFHAYALGVQIYKWNGASWELVGPDATLYAAPNFKGKVGTHYAGPTWESNSGSNVVAKRVVSCPVDSNAIDWLKLQAVSTDGPGIFEGVTFIQRVNTVGGKAPTTPGSANGTEVKVPYTAEYFFYRAEQ
jgi:hypothetical protein